MLTKVGIWYLKTGNFNDVNYVYMFSLGKGVKKENLNTTHVKIYEILTQMDLDNYLEHCFSRFNSDNNPLLEEPYQKFIKENKLHTSLSVGDVIQLEDKFYVCKGFGWEEL